MCLPLTGCGAGGGGSLSPTSQNALIGVGRTAGEIQGAGFNTYVVPPEGGTVAVVLVHTLPFARLGAVRISIQDSVIGNTHRFHAVALEDEKPVASEDATVVTQTGQNLHYQGITLLAGENPSGDPFGGGLVFNNLTPGGFVEATLNYRASP